MKIFLKLLILFAFILLSIINVFADENFNINSVTLDNSFSFATLNSNNLDNFNFVTPKLNKIQDENKVFFDIPNAILNCATQDFIINSDEINAIKIFQFSNDPNITRVEISYNEGFKPSNIRIKKAGNTIFIQFKYPGINNYYFQPVMQDLPVAPYFEDSKIQIKVPQKDNSILGQINSSFNSNATEQNYVLTDKNIALVTKYYIDDITFEDNIPLISGVGSYTISKPIYLENPSRVAFDIPNSIVNPAIRNQEFSFGLNQTIKIGQFDKTTSRIVITSANPEKFVPVIYPDNQRLVLFDKNENAFSLYRSITNLHSIKHETADNQNYNLKFIFTSPVIYGIDRKKDNLDLYVYNINSFSESTIRSELKNSPFANTKIAKTADGSLKLSFDTKIAKETDIHSGTDGKTLRLRQKLLTPYTPKEIKLETPEIVIPSIPEKLKGKKYVMIDPGHGGSDVGATRNKIYEKDITLDISKRVEKILKNKGYIVEMTRSNDKTVSLQERVEMSELFNPDIFVSIHVNSSNSETPYGLETHYYKDNSIYLAKCIHAAMLNNINSHDRGLFKSKFYVINHTTAPAILVETGFISNPSERAQLVTEARKNATAKAIAEGIDEYFKQQK